MKKGFTLIELLVVVAIIGMLSSVVLASLNGARANSRDARRLQDIKQMQTALELYYNINGSYPQICGRDDAWSSWPCWRTSGATNNPLFPSFMAGPALDPLNADLGSCGTTQNCYIYHYCRYNSGQSYAIVANLENGTGQAAHPSCQHGGPRRAWVSSN